MERSLEKTMFCKYVPSSSVRTAPFSSGRGMTLTSPASSRSRSYSSACRYPPADLGPHAQGPRAFEAREPGRERGIQVLEGGENPSLDPVGRPEGNIVR